MADQILTPQRLINGDKDLQTIEDFMKIKDETITTRFGDEIMTMNGLQEEVKKSGGYFKRYATLAAANADIANIPVDGVVKVTSAVGGGDYERVSEDATSLTKSPHDPVINSANYTDSQVFESQQSIYNYNEALKKNGNGVSLSSQFLTSASLDKVASITSAVSYTAEKDSLIEVVNVSIANTATTKQNIVATVNSIATDIAYDLKARDVVESGILKTKFSKPTIITADSLGSASVATEDKMRVVVLTSVTANSDFSSPNSIAIYSDKIPSSSQSLANSMTTDYCIFGHTSGYVAINISNSYLASLGYPATTAGIKRWFGDVIKRTSIEYYTTIETQYPCLPSLQVKSGDIISVTTSGTLTANIYAKPEKGSKNISAYTEFKCDVDNNSAYSFANYPIELKVDFERGLVSSNDQLFIEDQNGIQIPAQFEQARNNNVRKSGRIGQFIDGSFRTGSVWISDSISANTKKDYVLKLKKQTVAASPVLNKTTTGYSINVNGYTYNFESTQAFLLSSVKVLTATKGYLSSAVCREVNADNTAFNTLDFTLDPEINLVSSGPVFSEVEVTVYNQAGQRLAAKDLKLTVNYMLFASGKMRIKTLLSATKDIAKNTLSGYTLYHQLNISGGTRSTAYGSALLTASEASLASPISVVMTVANGDIHRDGQDYGPSRPTTAVFSASTSNVRTAMGWDIGAIGQTSLVNYGVPKNWTWTTEVWVNFNETQSTVEKCSQACVNRPVGFFGKTINKFLAKEFVINKMIENARGYYAAVTAPETAVVGGISRDQKTNYHYPILLDLTETLLLDKSIDTVWSNFVAYMNRNFKPDGQAEIDLKQYYLDGRMSSQYIWYRVLCPIQYFYQFAVKQGKTNIVDTCKLWIGQYAEAVVQTVNNLGWFPLTPSILSPAANANSTGIWALGLAINMGIDTDGRYEATFDTLSNLVTNPDANGRWLPIVLDTMDSADNIAKQRWMRYEGVINYMFNEGHVLAGKTSVVEMTNNFIRFSNGDGNLQLIDASRSESRRGAFQEPIEILHACVRKNTKSSLNLAYAIAKNYELYAPYDLLKSNRMYDVNPLNSSWNDTVKQVDTFSFLFCKPVLDDLLNTIV